MIEVLIALLVLAIGLLGFALLQTMNLKYTQSANYRTEATNLASQLLDQMRSNRLSAAQYSGATFAAGSVNLAGCPTTITATVSPTDYVAEWKCDVVRALGSQANANVTFNAGTASVVLNWGEKFADDPNNADTSTTFEVRTQL